MMRVDSMRLKMPLPFPLRDDDDTQRVTEAAHAASRRGTSRRPRFSAALPIAVALLAFGATPASAVGLTLNWGGCIGAGTVTNQEFDCVHGLGPYSLVMNMQPPALTGFFAVDLVLDLQTSQAALSPFWHFESGGCNEVGLTITANRSSIPNVGCLSTVTGTTGAGVSSLITAYAPGFGGASNARLLVTVARASSSPINLTAGSNYYLSHLIFALDLATEGGGSCDGCSEGATIFWNSATLYTLPGSESTTLTGPGLGSNVVTINGGRVVGLRLTSISPTWGADSGTVQVRIIGTSIDPAATARLRRTGQSDIVGQSTTVQPDSSQLETTFDLTGRLAGPWNVVVQNPDNTTASLNGAFQILLTPHANSIAPSSASNSDPISSCVVSGHGFASGASVKLVRAGQPTISGSGTVVAGDGTSINVGFALSNAAPGLWDVLVDNLNGLTSTLVNGFQVLGLQINSINPNSGADSVAVTALILGLGMDPAATARLTRTGDSDIIGQATSVTADSTHLTTTFDLTGRLTGPWNVVVRNPGGATASLANGFTILPYTSFASGLDLSWNACNQAAVPGTDDITLDCGNPGAVAELFANFQSPQTLPGFIALDAVLDIQTGGVSLPAFWHFEDGGCNDGGLALLDAKPQAVCPDATNGTPWGNGSSSDALITAYAPGFGGVNHARLLLTIARASNDPVTIDSGRNYYGFHLEIASAGAASCLGCATPAQIIWSSATLYGSFPGQSPVVLAGPGLRSNVVTVNGGPSGITVASMVPSRGFPDSVVTALIFGRNFLPGVAVKLTRTGSPDIVGQAVSVAADGRSVMATFDLSGATSGPRDIVATNPGGASARATDAFQVLSQKPAAHVVFPNGGERFVFDQLTQLRWSASDDQQVTSIDLYLSYDGGQSFEVLGFGLPNDGYFGWVVRSPASNRCLFKVVAHDADGRTGEDVSDAVFQIGDVSTATELALFECGWVDDRVEIRWRFADGSSFARVAVERAGNERGPWTSIDAAFRSDGDAMVATDASASPDAASYYRLAATSADGNTRFFGPIVVTPAGGTAMARETAITLVAPNPTAGALRIGFALARAGNVRLSVMDVQGREVATLARGEYAAGRFETTWNGRVGEEDAPMGVYFVRLRVGSVTMTRRLAVAR